MNGHEFVDLGLSVKWATCNIGADSPSDFGGYFAWGESSAKSVFQWTNYKYWLRGDSHHNVVLSMYNTNSEYGSIDNKVQLDLSDDAARQNWRGQWRIPTKDEWTELNSKCTWTWTALDGKHGYKVTGENGNSIFLPAAGYRDGIILGYDGSYGYYWSSSLDTVYPYSAMRMNIKSRNRSVYSAIRYYGFSIRPVTE